MLARSKPRNTYGFYAAPGLTILAITIGGAFLYNVYYSFTKWIGFGHAEFIGITNYIRIFGNAEIRRSVVHAIYYIIPFAIIPTFLGVFIAALLYDYIAPRFGDNVASFFRSMFYLPQIVPMAMTGVLFQWFLNNRDGIVNEFLANNGLEQFVMDWQSNQKAMQVIFSLALIWIQMGFTLIIFISGLSRLDQRVLEAAQLDGATWFQQFRLLTLPMIRPEMAVVLLTTTISAIKIFAPVYWITSGGPNGATSVPSTFVFNQFYGGSQLGQGAALATLFAGLLGAIAYFILKYQRKMGMVEA